LLPPAYEQRPPKGANGLDAQVVAPGRRQPPRKRGRREKGEGGGVDGGDVGGDIVVVLMIWVEVEKLKEMGGGGGEAYCEGKLEWRR